MRPPGSDRPSTTWSRSKSSPGASTRPSGTPAAPRMPPRRRRGASPRRAATRAPPRARHPQDYPLERAALARALGVEERQLAELGVDSDEREGVRRLDQVHAEVVAEEGGQRLAIVDPEGHVVEAGRGEGRSHGASITPAEALPISSTSSAESSICGRHVLLEVLDRGGARDRQHHRRAREQPRQRDLRGGGVVLRARSGRAARPARRAGRWRAGTRG